MNDNKSEQAAKEMAEIAVRVLFPHIEKHSGGAANHLKDNLMKEWRKLYGNMWQAERVTCQKS